MFHKVLNQKKSKFLLILLIIFTCSCSVTKKSRIRTETITITKIDTIIHIAYDTVTTYNSATVTDTVTIENKVARAKSFVDVTTGKIVISLQGKIFDVPVKASVIERKKEDIKSVEKKFKWYLWFFSGFFLYWICFFVYKFIKKYLSWKIM